MKKKTRSERFPSARVTKTTIKQVKKATKEKGESVADVLERLFDKWAEERELADGDGNE